MSRHLSNKAHTRGGVVYWAVNTHPEVWRIRLEKYPDHGSEGSHGWFGGKVLWGHDKDNEPDALEVLRAWVDRGELPEGVAP